ncbi:MAG: hypothetical protein AAGI48_03865 [Verrucomicrobiota bacterium]
MAKKQEINPKDGKRFVRDVLQSARGYGVNEATLIEKVNELGDPDEADEAAVRSWVEFNQGRGWVTYRYDEDSEEDLWYLTERGQAKQNQSLK